MKKLRLKKSVYVFLVLIILAIIGINYSIKVYKQYKYEQTYEYKFLEIGYTKDEIKLLNNTFDNKQLDALVTKEKDEFLLSLISNTYFIKTKLNDYLSYYEEYNKVSASDVITIINTNRNHDYYENMFDTDESKDTLMLVNKYYKLSKDFKPNNLVAITNKYAWGTNKSKSIREDVMDAYLNMYNAAFNEIGVTLMINSAYRDYEHQEEVYNDYKENRGIDYADSVAARPGSSEHQTGLSLDIFELKNSKMATFKDTEAYKWLKNNCYKYGFILRYPEGKENITGFNFEAWHYRYVGIETATYIYEKNITFDEYYAYFLAR